MGSGDAERALWDKALYSSVSKSVSGDFNAAVKLETTRMLVAALKASDLPEEVSKFLGEIDLPNATQDQLDTLVSKAQALAALGKVFEQFASVLPSLAGGSLTAKERLVSLSGGLDALASGLASYRDAYFTDAEKQTATRATLSKTLAEVGNLTMEMQQMLLRAIQERRYRPVGAKEDKTANVRIVAATNEDLQKAVTEKRFRQDLLYRLQEYVITMPPLRDCPEDIMPLAEFFREMANRELEREVKGFAASARNALLAHAWPGNVRELKQKIQTAVLQSEGDMITEADLELDNEPSATSACFTLKSGDEERGRILRALKQAAGNKKMAAKILGIGRTTLYNKLVEYGLNEEN
jgi:hypothetical protein